MPEPSDKPSTAVLHYTAPPVVGGVEAVIWAHAQVFLREGYPLAVVAGRGESSALPPGVEFLPFIEMDSRHPSIYRVNLALEQGEVPSEFDSLVSGLTDSLASVLQEFDNVIVHNLFTKHFNLPLTAALFRLLDSETLRGCIAWCHDFSWTSPNAARYVSEGYPWDLLRTYHPDLTYVTVSKERQVVLAELLGCPTDQIHVVYNGVDPQGLLGLTKQGMELVERLDLLESDLNLLMPVRVTQAKNIEFALQMAATIKGMGLRLKLVLTGPPDPHDERSMGYYQSLQAMRNRLGLEHEMHFVFEAGPDPQQPFTIDAQVVGDLYRVADAVFMPSHREGFGMPVLEAGLSGIPVISTAIPAAVEIGGEEVLLFSPDDDPAATAARLVDWVGAQPSYRLRRRVRQKYTWQSIFQRDIQPLLKGRARGD